MKKKKIFLFSFPFCIFFIVLFKPHGTEKVYILLTSFPAT